MSNTLLRNYIEILLKEENNWARTDLPAYKPNDKYKDEYEEISPVNNKQTEILPIGNKKKPKNKTFLGLLLALAASAGGMHLVTNSDIQKAKQADKGNEKAIEDTSKKINDLKYVIPSVRWKTDNVEGDSASFTRSKEVNASTQSFVALPYYDNGNISIGYGTNIDRSGKKGKETNHPNLNSSNPTLKSKAIKKAVQLVYDSYGISKKASDSGITESEAERIFTIAYSDHIRKLMKSSPWLNTKATPSIVELVAYDMGYNVGPAVFSKKFKKAGKALRTFIEMLEIYSQTKDRKDLENSLESLSIAIEEIKDSNAYRDPKQARDNAVESGQAWWETRFERHIRLLNELLESLQDELDNLQY